MVYLLKLPFEYMTCIKYTSTRLDSLPTGILRISEWRPNIRKESGVCEGLLVGADSM